MFKPIIWLLNQLKFPAKFALIFMLFLVPIVYVIYSTIDTHSEIIRIAEREKFGIDYLTKLKPIYTNMAQTRGMTNAYLNGQSEMARKIQQKRQNLINNFIELSNIDKKLTTILKTSNKVTDLQSKWQQLQQDAFDLSAAESFSRHTALIKQTLLLNEHIIESSGLILDSNPIGHFLMDASFMRLPILIENMGKARGLGAGIAAAGESTPKTYLQIVNYINTIDTALNNMNHSMHIVFEEDPYYKTQLNHFLETANTKTSRFISISENKIISADNINIDSTEYFNSGSDAIASVLVLFDALIPTLNNVLNERINTYKTEMTVFLILGIFLLSITIYIFIGFYKGIMSSINQIGAFVNKIAEGDLNLELELESKDEIKIIADDLNLMVKKINLLVSQVITNINIVASSADESSIAVNNTLNGVNIQNNEIDQVATAMTEMSATVHEVAQNAARTSNATKNADEQTNNGREIVKHTIQSIDSVSSEMQKVTDVINILEEDSGNIGTVLDVIKSIAEQTNLLALNAAIEAARAGEQGRGFAVVADEVRTLASRTQISTAEIHDIIEKIQQGASNAVAVMHSSNKQTQLAVKKAAEAGEALDAITQAVDDIAQMNFQIASAAEEQSQVAEEINRNIVNVNEIATETVDGANKTASSSESLKQVAVKLQTIVSDFKV